MVEHQGAELRVGSMADTDKVVSIYDTTQLGTREPNSGETEVCPESSQTSHEVLKVYQGGTSKAIDKYLCWI